MSMQINTQRPIGWNKVTFLSLAELDKLAAGGYITPEEYKQKKQSIIDSMYLQANSRKQDAGEERTALHRS